MQYAAAKIGALLVNINPAYRTHELSYVLTQAGVTVLVIAESFKTSDYVAMVEQVRGDCPALAHVVVIGTAVLGRPGRGRRGRRRGSAAVARRRTLSCDDPINIQYTSGTTGFPKGATLSHHNILNNGYFVAGVCGFTEADKVVLPVPFYHCFGMVMGNLGATSHGATIVIPSPGFDPAATLAAVQETGATVLYGVPTMFIAELALADFPSYDLSTLRTGIMAGSPCPVEVMKRVVAEMHMAEVTIAYGMTETSPVSTQTRRDDDLERRVSTVGSVHPHVEVKVVDPVTGVTLPRGEAGELCTRGYSVMVGYWDEPEKTADVLDRAGLDAHRRPGHHGRRRLPQHRRPDQGPRDPRRRERLPARDRGVPLLAPGHRGRAGDRRPGCEVRRGAVRLDPDARRGRAARRRGGAGVLRRQARALQGARATCRSSTSSR